MIAERLTAQLLSGPPAGNPVAVAERLLAIQGQDPRGARLAVRARSAGLSAADVDRALTDERSLVITWVNRGTLHLLRSEDYPWLHALTAPTHLMSARRRLTQLGVSPRAADRAVATVERVLADEGPLPRAELGRHVAEAGLRVEGPALLHLLFLAAQRGLIVRGPMAGKHHAYALTRDWLGEPRPVDRERALAELARRYLAGHGPAGDRDLAKWAGLPLRDVRAGLKAIGRELEERDDGLVDLAKRPAAAELPPPRLLGAFDPVLLGWASREPILGTNAQAITIGGMFLPFAMVRGRAAGVWRFPGGQVQLEPFAKLTRKDGKALEADADEVVRFLGS